MIESFVDLTYRGLSLGKRVKLTQVRPTTGYLETPAPMPVGTEFEIATDEGLVLEAIVRGIHEQVGGSDRVPGMTFSPKLADEGRQAWWTNRVALPEEPPPSPRAARVTVRPRSQAISTPPQTLPGIAVAAPDVEVTQPQQVIHDEPPGSATTIMPAIDQELLESLTRKSGEIEAISTTGDHAVVDDGKMTMMMDAVDPASLGLDIGDSGSMPVAEDDDSTDDPRKSSPALGGAVKKRKKKR
jgi:hypothetical protein